MGDLLLVAVSMLGCVALLLLVLIWQPFKRFPAYAVDVWYSWDAEVGAFICHVREHLLAKRKSPAQRSAVAAIAGGREPAPTDLVEIKLQFWRTQAVSRALAAIDAALAAPGGDETWNEAIRAAVQVSLDHVEFEQGRRTELLSRGKLSSHLDASDLHLQGASVAAKIGKDISRLLRPAPTQDGGDG